MPVCVREREREGECQEMELEGAAGPGPEGLEPAGLDALFGESKLERSYKAFATVR